MMDGSSAPGCPPNSGLEHLTLSAVTGAVPVSSSAGGISVRSVSTASLVSHSHHVTTLATVMAGTEQHRPGGGHGGHQPQQQTRPPTMQSRHSSELPAELFCGGPDPSRIPGLVIEQVSVSVGASGRQPPPPPPSEDVIVVDVNLGTPVGEVSGVGVRQPLHHLGVTGHASHAGAAVDTGGGGGGGTLHSHSESRAGRRGREPALPSMETLRPSGEVTLTPVTLPGVCRVSTAASVAAVSAASAVVSAPVVSVSGEPNYEVIMSSCLRSGPLVQLNTADLEVLPLPATHAPIDVTSFCTDSQDGLGSPPKLEMLSAVSLPHVSLPNVEAPVVTAPVVSGCGRLPPPYPRAKQATGGGGGGVSLSAICQQLVERVEAHKCALCSYVTLNRQDVTTHLMATHRPELDRRRRRGPSPPSRVVSATSQAHVVVNAHGRMRVQARPPPAVDAPAPVSVPIAAPATTAAVTTAVTAAATVDSPEINVEAMDESAPHPASGGRQDGFAPDAEMADSDEDLEVTWMGGSDAADNGADSESDPQPVEAETVSDSADPLAVTDTVDPLAVVADEETEDDPDDGPRQSRALLGLVSSLQPATLQGVIAGKKKGRPRDSRSLGLTALAGGRGTADQRQMERELGLLQCQETNCGVRLRDAEKLDQHQRCHVPDNPSEYACTECDQTSRKWRAMAIHLWREHRIECDLFHCDRCNYKTARYSQLMNVHMPTHGQVRNFSCLTCQKAFKTAKQLQNHRAKHRYKQDPAYIESCRCDICCSVLSDRRALALHKQMVHEKKRHYQCKACGNVFSCRSSLVMHERQHSGQKPFQCEHCPYSSTDHNTMRRHKMRHTGERPYKCPHCEYSCIQSSTYKKHLRDKHPGEADDLVFSCHVCMFKTIQRTAYVRHMQDHPDAGPAPPEDQPANAKLPPPPISRAQPPPPAPAPLTLHQLQQQQQQQQQQQAGTGGELQQHVVRVHETPAVPPPAPMPALPTLPTLSSLPQLSSLSSLPVVSAVSGAQLVGAPGPLKVAAVSGGLANTAMVYQLIPQGNGRPPVVTHAAQIQLLAPPGPVGRPARTGRGGRGRRGAH